MENLNPIEYPGVARRYCELSTDKYCTAHLLNWICEKSASLASYRQWLEFRLRTDMAKIVNIDGTQADLDNDCSMIWSSLIGDTSYLDNLNALG